MRMNKLFFVCIFVSALFFGCSYNEENDYQQTVINNSSYDVEVNGTLISSKTSATFDLSMSADDDDEFLKITSTDYPRVTMTRDAISFHRYEYTISDYADTTERYENDKKYKYVYSSKQVIIYNKTNSKIKVSNPYFCKKYDADFSVEVAANSSLESGAVITRFIYDSDKDEYEEDSTYTEGNEDSSHPWSLRNDYDTFTAVDTDNDVSASVTVEPIRYTVSDDVTESSKRKGNGHIIGYKVIVR